MKHLSLTLIAALVALFTACEPIDRNNLPTPQSRISSSSFILTDSSYIYQNYDSSGYHTYTTATKINTAYSLFIDSQNRKCWYYIDTFSAKSNLDTFALIGSAYIPSCAYQTVTVTTDSVFIQRSLQDHGNLLSGCTLKVFKLK